MVLLLRHEFPYILCQAAGDCINYYDSVPGIACLPLPYSMNAWYPMSCTDTCISITTGMGGKVAEALAKAGVQCALDLKRWAPEQLAAAVGLSVALATTLVAWGCGVDDTPVVDKGPPKSLQVGRCARAQ